MDLEHAQRVQALPRQAVQIAQPMPGTRRTEGLTGAGIAGNERIAHFITDLVMLRPGSRPQPGDEIVRGDGHRPPPRPPHAPPPAPPPAMRPRPPPAHPPPQPPPQN